MSAILSLNKGKGQCYVAKVSISHRWRALLMTGSISQMKKKKRSGLHVTYYAILAVGVASRKLGGGCVTDLLKLSLYFRTNYMGLLPYCKHFSQASTPLFQTTPYLDLP